MYLGTISVAPLLSVNAGLLTAVSCLITPFITGSIVVRWIALRRPPSRRREGTLRRSAAIAAIAGAALLGVAAVGVVTYVTAATTNIADRQAARLEQFGLQNVKVDAATHTFTGTYTDKMFYGHLEANSNPDWYTAYTDRVVRLQTS